MDSLPADLEIESHRFTAQVDAKLQALLEPLEAIRSLPSSTADQVRQEERAFRDFVRSRDPFRLVGDLWCSALCEDAEIITEQYQQALDELGKPRRFAKLSEESWFHDATELAGSQFSRCFHWELEFPEVFFDGTTRRETSGFDVVIGNPPWGEARALPVLQDAGGYDAVASDLAECFICLGRRLLAGNGRIGQVLPDTILSPAKSDIRRYMLEQVRTEELLNVGPDWFTSQVRMATVLWTGAQDDTTDPNYSFSTCILPIRERKATQANRMSLDAAIASCLRSAHSLSCLADSEVAVPLFGDNSVVEIMQRITNNAPSIAAICMHARGVELNKAGDVIRCPDCGLWDAPARKDASKTILEKTCAHCGSTYDVVPSVERRRIVSDLRPDAPEWQPYVIGDEIKRYGRPKYNWLDISAKGVDYKDSSVYASPKIFIRQAGIGVNAILDVDRSAYCPQSIYIYSVKPEFRNQGLDNELLLAFICSRLFHLQVFMAFGEIDSSRAFSKLTHQRLSRLRGISPDLLSQRTELVSRIHSRVQLLAEHGTTGREDVDWEIEACWSVILDLSAADIRHIVRNFSHVHESEVILTLFPGGLEGKEERWTERWIEAMQRVKGHTIS